MLFSMVLGGLGRQRKAAAGGGGGTEIASDNFDRTNGAIGANWTSLNAAFGGDPTIQTNSARSDYATGDDMAAGRWDGSGTFSDNQYSSAVITATSQLNDGYRCGVITRASADTGSGRDFYAAYVSMDGGATKTWRLIKIVNGTVTVLTSGTEAWADGDTIRLESNGTSHTVKRNGTTIGSPQTDSALTTGKPGICVCGGLTAGPGLDSWSGGDL